MTSKRDFLGMADLSPQETRQVLDRAREMKAGDSSLSLQGKHVALLFEKPSLRTKVSFQVGIQQLRGYSLYLGPEEVGLGTREPVSDVARVLSGYVDCIVARVNSHESLVQLAQYASVPVVNALSDVEHPCQIMADLLTINEHQGDWAGLKLAYIGDGNNVARSLSLALPAVGMNFAIASPEGYTLDETSLAQARGRCANDAVEIVSLRDPVKAVKGADVVYTDVWTSMGDEVETYTRLQAFQGYMVNPELLALAKPTARFMHDMPAHYGEEVPPGMLEHPQSVAYHQAHNRLHAQKAVLEFLLAGR